MFNPNCVVLLPAPELSIKSSAVRSLMLKRLKKNMVLYLKHAGVDYGGLKFIAGRVIIPSKEPKKVLAALENCFGIFALSLAEEVGFASLDELAAKGAAISEGVLTSGTFAVRGKSFSGEFSSKKLEEELGRFMLDKFPALKVKLKGPEHELHCVAYKSNAFIYFDSVVGARGMPLGSQGKVGLVVSNDGKEADLVKLAMDLMKCGCSVALVSDESKLPDLLELLPFNCFLPLKHFSLAEAHALYAQGDLAAFFSTAKSAEQAKKDSALAGVKVFVPLLA